MFLKREKESSLVLENAGDFGHDFGDRHTLQGGWAWQAIVKGPATFLRIRSEHSMFDQLPSFPFINMSECDFM